MAPRSALQSLLEELMPDESKNVYFQPPPTIQLKYPCIIYRRQDVSTEYADNDAYKRMKSYQVTIIDRDPDSDIPDKVAMLPLCSYDRFFTSDNLNHDVYNLFF